MGEEDIPWEQWQVSLLGSFVFEILLHLRIINAELRQPKSDRGM